jgi:rhodanese-related sulfurtransferase
MLTLIVIVQLLVIWELVFWTQAGVQPLAPWNLRKRMYSDTPPTIVDVRTPAEYRLFHIPGVPNRPDLLKDPDKLAGEISDKDQPIVIACMTGHRSSIVGWRLKKKGYTNVYNLTGGVVGWAIAERDVKRGDQAAT